jgi:hypothetical protein
MKIERPRLITGLGWFLLCVSCAATPLPEEDFELTGSGNLRWFGLKIYTASLWSRPTEHGREQLLLIEYARGASSERLYASTRDEWVQLHGQPGPKATAWLDELERIYPDVATGSRLACLVEPGGPTRFYLNDQSIGTIAAPDFGPEFLAIWLAPETSRPRLRRKLLGLD